MIIEFSVGNYKSFKEIVTFSMVAAKISSKDKKLDENNVFEINDRFSLLKSAAIYGANGSGKSNFIEAMRFMRWFVRNSSKATQTEDLIDIEEFKLNEDTIGKPSFFQMVFLMNGKRFRYGFEVDKQHVVSEWLFHVPKKIEAKLFVREGDDISLSNTFKEGRSIKDKTRSNALFLSVAAQFNGPISTEILQWFRMLRIYSGGLREMTNYSYTLALLDNPKYKERVLQLIKRLDLGIHSIEVERRPLELELITSFPEDMPEALRGALINFQKESYRSSSQSGDVKTVRVKTVHPKYDAEGHQVSFEEFDINTHESAGTQKAFILAGSLVDTLKNGKVLLIDELDIRLHPLITCAIIDLFNSNETNSKNAQLIFTTHDTNLLNNKIFRRDQIWFTEKDRQEATRLYSLVEYKVRNDASFESDYIHGKYGAIPFIGDLRRVLGEPNEQQASL